MQIYFNYITSIFSTFFIIIEYIIIIFFLIIFLKKINDLIQFPNVSYDKIDLIIIYLSSLQLFLFLVQLIKNYNIFSVLISINKFSQNLMICALLLLYNLEKFKKGKTNIIKYFLVTLLILDIIIFLVYINDNQPFDTKYNETIDHLILYLLCLIMDFYIWFKSFVNKRTMSDQIIANNGNNKLDNIINKEEDLINIDNLEKNDDNENRFINAIYIQNLQNVIVIITIYFYILLTFVISYLVDFILYFSYKSSKSSNIDIDDNYNITNCNITIPNNDSEFNNTYRFLQDKETQFTFWNLIVYFIFFFFRDIFPYVVIYLMFFIYKLKYYHRPSF